MEFDGEKSSSPAKNARRNWKPNDPARDSAADYERRRLLVKAHEKERRRAQKEKLRRENAERLETAKPNKYLPAGAWTVHESRQVRNGRSPAPPAPEPKIGEDELEKMIDRAHKTWKKNSPLLYEFVMIQAFDTSCLTAQWLPERIPIHGTEYLEHRLLLGTYSGLTVAKKDKPRDYLMVGALQLPRNHGCFDNDAESQKLQADLIYSEIEIRTKIPHSGEVNRARHMPQDSKIVATKAGGGGGEVYLFNLSKHPPKPRNEDGQGRHEMTLRGHREEGYGLSWSERKPGHLLSASYDHNICLWDVNGNTTDCRSGKVLDPLNTFKGHSDAAGDVSWHPHHERIFGSVGDDTFLMIWDSREKSPKQKVSASEYAVNALSFNHVNEHVLATASGCKGCGTVSIWDLRHLSEPVRKLALHNDVVDQVCWSPHSQHVLASASQDRRMHLLDLSVTSEGESVTDPKELLFVHAGHQSRVSDFSWNPHIPWLILSVSDGESCVDIWEPCEVLREPDLEDEDSDASSYDSEELEEELRGESGRKTTTESVGKRSGGRVSKSSSALFGDGSEGKAKKSPFVGAGSASTPGPASKSAGPPDDVENAAEDLLIEICRKTILDELCLELAANQDVMEET